MLVVKLNNSHVIDFYTINQMKMHLKNNCIDLELLENFVKKINIQIKYYKVTDRI